jgi:hypothetical protein
MNWKGSGSDHGLIEDISLNLAGRTEKNHKNLYQDNSFPCLGFNPGHPKYEERV